MDRMQACGVCDRGSIPRGDTKHESKKSALRRFSAFGVGRSDVLRARKTARRGRENSECRRGITCDHCVPTASHLFGSHEESNAGAMFLQ